MDSQTLAILLLVAHIVIGIILCFFGNKWLKPIVAVYGFAVCFLLTYMLLPILTSLNPTPILLVSIGAGIVGALLFVLLIYVGIFFIGFGAGISLCLLIIRAFGLNVFDWYVYVPTLLIASVFGSLALNWRRIFISIFTAFIGASALANAAFQIANGVQADTLTSYYSEQATYNAYSSVIYLVTLGVLFVAGLVIQLAVTGKKTPKKS